MEYIVHLGLLFLFYLVVAYSQAAITGYLKLLTISQAAFVAVGAYAAALLATKAGMPFPLTLIAGICAAGVFSLIAYVAFADLNEEDQVLASLAFQIILIEALLNLDRITNGSLGIAGITLGIHVSSQTGTWLLVATLGLLAFLGGAALINLGHAAFGKRLLLIGEDRVLAEAMGINVRRARLITMFAAASMAGAAGAIFAHYLTFIEPYSFGLGESVFVLAIVIIGGGRQPFQIAIATGFLVLVPEVLRFILGSGPLAANFRQLLFGVALVGALAFRSLKSYPELSRR